MTAMAKEQTKNFNFSLPVELADEFRKIGDVHGERNKLRWAIAGAAMLCLLELPDEKKHELIRQVVSSRYYPESLQDMIRQAKSKADSDKSQTKKLNRH
jgi:hypothetical protein